MLVHLNKEELAVGQVNFIANINFSKKKLIGCDAVFGYPLQYGEQTV